MRLPFFRHRRGTITQLYDEAQLLPHVRKGLNWIMAGNLFGTLNYIICGAGSAAIVGLAGALGANDIEFGLLSAIPNFASCLQLPCSMLVNRTRRRKFYLLTFGLASRLLWLVFGFMPMMMRSPADRMPLYVLMALLSVSSCLGAFINVCWFPWFSDLAPISIRGRWLGWRDRMTAIASFLFSLLVAYMLDVLPPSSKYPIVFLVGGALGAADMISFAFPKEEWHAPAQNIEWRKLLREIAHNKPYLKVVLLWTVWGFTSNLSGTYLTPYAMNSMQLSFMQIMLFGSMTAALATAVAVPRWGRALDACGTRNVVLISCFGASLTPLFYLFSTPGSIWPTFLHNAVGALFWSGCNLMNNSMQLSSSPEENRPTYVAVFCSVTWIFGMALGSMTGGAMLEFFNANSLFTGSFDRYKALILISVVLRFALTMLIARTLTNENGATLRDAFRVLLPHRKRAAA